ncbi:MAG: hypothetical protein WA655_05160, partial [Candidatus Korobacteraceae bacterium]
PKRAALQAAQASAPDALLPDLLHTQLVYFYSAPVVWFYSALDTWCSAQRLASEPTILHDATVDALDLAVSVEGRAILDPPVGAEELKIIQQAETKDVRVVIETLAQSNSNTFTMAAGA